jgi:hypothetical protein
MSVRAIAELAQDLRERLPEWLGVVATRYGIPLPTDPLILDWWQVATDEPAQRYPVVHVRHAGARLGILQQHEGVHDSTHSVVIEFEHLSEQREVVAACMGYAAEAFVRYLDTYPLGSRVAGGLIQKIAAPDGQALRLTVDEVMARVIPQPAEPSVIQYRWGMSLSFDLSVRDTTWSDQP